ncbi:MAG: hypothetical protein NT118_03745 [Lentisphaerae bacterium]|nr:hypothetical protein [Lentisphaerota bacterium]
MILKLILPVIVIVVMLAACDRKPSFEDGYRSGVATGYRAGAANTAKLMEQSADKFRSELRHRAQRSLLIFAVITAVLTLYGDGLLEYLRTKFSEVLKIPVGVQLMIAGFLYSALAIGMSLFGIRNFGFLSALPLLILGTASCVPFCKYVSAVSQGDKTRSKAAIAKVKALLFLASSVLIVYAMLSKAGFMNIRICG